MAFEFLNANKKLRQIIGSSLGADLVEYNLEKAIEKAREQSLGAPKAMFYDPLSIFMGYEWLQKKPGSLTYRDLRAMAKNPIIASIIQTRMNQCAMFCYPQREAYDAGFKITSDDDAAQNDQEKIKEISEFMYNAGVEGYGEPSLETWTRKFVRDSLILDQACSEIVYRRNGLPGYFVTLDAATVRRLKESLNYATPPSSSEPYYVQIREHFMQIVAEYAHDQLMFGIRNPQTDIFQLGYGQPELETLLRIVTTLINAERYNTSQLAQGGTRKGVLVVATDANVPEFDAFKRDFRSAIAQASQMWKPPVLKVGKESKVDWVELDAVNKDMEYAALFDFLVKQACGVFQISPEEINWSIGSQGTTVNFEAKSTEKIVYSQRRGLKPLLTFLGNILTSDVVARIDPRYRLEFVGLERDRVLDVDIRVKEVGSYKTINEVRADAGLDPIEGGDIVGSQIFMANRQAEQQREDQLIQQTYDMGFEDEFEAVPIEQETEVAASSQPAG